MTMYPIELADARLTPTPMCRVAAHTKAVKCPATSALAMSLAFTRNKPTSAYHMRTAVMAAASASPSQLAAMFSPYLLDGLCSNAPDAAILSDQLWACTATSSDHSTGGEPWASRRALTAFNTF